MDMKGLLPPGVQSASHHFGADTKRSQGVQGASKWAIAGFTVLHATKALIAQGVAYGVMIGSRMIARELLEAARNSSEEDLGTAAILSAAAVGTFVFDQLCTTRAVSMMYGWLKNDGDGAPAQPVGSKTGIALALIPTALSGALLAREVYGTSENGTLLAVDLGAMMIGWRAGRLARDVIQQGVAQYLPKLTIVDADTGRPLTHQQKKTFDDTRLGYQLTGYTATVFIGAFVTTPALRGYLGNDERADSAKERLFAMLAPMINSVLVEAFDEVISPLVQSWVAPRQNLVIKKDPGERPKDLGKAMLDQGSMRAFMGVFVTDLAQLILSIDRGGDFVKSLGTAIGSVATSIMEIRAKSVGVQSGLRDNLRTFKTLSDELIRAAQEVTGHKFTPEQWGDMRMAIRDVRNGFARGGWGADAVKRTEYLSGNELAGLTETTLRGKQPRMNFQATPQGLNRLESYRTFEPSLDQAQRLLDGKTHVPALPLLRKRLEEQPTVATPPRELPDVVIDVKGQAGGQQLQPADIETKTPFKRPPQGSVNLHLSPGKPTSPRAERQSSAKHEFPICKVLNTGGTELDPNNLPHNETLTFQTGSVTITGSLASDGPAEPGFVYINPGLGQDTAPFGVLVNQETPYPLLKLKVADQP